jgi:seryl-tRNA synthetase
VAAEIVLSSAGCHALYATLRGQRLQADQLYECQAFVFRHEPSLDPARMQAFRMHEFVYLGDADGAVAHRDRWVDRGLTLFRGLGLEVESVVANDPFFGRGGRMLAANQRETSLKYEITAPITTDEATALASANYHLDHFGAPFEIVNARGSVAHTACFGFGIERIALALLRRHGLDPGRWPGDVRGQLWPAALTSDDRRRKSLIDVSEDVVDVLDPHR